MRKIIHECRGCKKELLQGEIPIIDITYYPKHSMGDNRLEMIGGSWCGKQIREDEYKNHPENCVYYQEYLRQIV